MAGNRFILAMLLTLTLASVGPAQTRSKRTRPAARAESGAVICKVYSLAELGEDAGLGLWVADTIPEVIQPGTWATPPRSRSMPQAELPPSPVQRSYYQPSAPTEMGEAAVRTLSYYSPAKLLMVSHTAAVHEQVEAFLKNLKKAMPTASTPPTPTPIAQAGYAVPNRVPESVAYNKSSAYPVPAPLSQPKHLFHFIIRYEGDGTVDANVANMVKSYFGGTVQEETGGKKPASPSLSQLFNFVIRYEGDGIVDSNVVELMKSYMKAMESERNVTPAGAYLQRIPETSPPTCVPPPSGSPVRMPPAEGGPTPSAFPATPAGLIPVAPTSSYYPQSGVYSSPSGGMRIIR